MSVIQKSLAGPALSSGSLGWFTGCTGCACQVGGPWFTEPSWMVRAGRPSTTF